MIFSIIFIRICHQSDDGSSDDEKSKPDTSHHYLMKRFMKMKSQDLHVYTRLDNIYEMSESRPYYS